MYTKQLNHWEIFKLPLTICHLFMLFIMRWLFDILLSRNIPKTTKNKHSWDYYSNALHYNISRIFFTNQQVPMHKYFKLIILLHKLTNTNLALLITNTSEITKITNLTLWMNLIETFYVLIKTCSHIKILSSSFIAQDKIKL